MIHLIVTAANISQNYESRRELYISSFEKALKYDYLFDTYTILECTSSYEEYLTPYNVYYSTIPNQYPEKGLNEMQHLKGYLEQSSFNDNDIIIKLTGRYLLADNSFFNKVKLLKDDYDSIFKDDGDIYQGHGYHTFLYAMKKFRFLDTINSLHFSEENNDPIEWGVKNFLKDKNRHYLLDRLGIIAYQGTFQEKIFKS